MRIYCAFRENMSQVRGDFCVAKLLISPRTVTIHGLQAVNSNRTGLPFGTWNFVNFIVEFAAEIYYTNYMMCAFKRK